MRFMVGYLDLLNYAKLSKTTIIPTIPYSSDAALLMSFVSMVDSGRAQYY